MAKYRAYTWTLNNYTEQDVGALQAHECQYICYGHERAPTTGTPHLQGYVYYTNPRSQAAVKKLFKWHVVPSRGDPDSNYKYCRGLTPDKTPNEEWYERGVKPDHGTAQGEAEQDRWTGIWNAAREGRMSDIPPDVRIRHYSTIKRIRVEENYTKPPLLAELDNYWIYGPADSGKSTYVRERWPEHYLKTFETTWNGYDGEDVVRFKEFSPQTRHLTQYLKLWAEHEPFKIRGMYGMDYYIRPKTIVVESNFHPNEIWSEPDLKAIMRRFKVIKHDYRI